MSAALIPDPRLLAPDPAAFPYALDTTLTEITFVPVTRAAIAEAPMLDHRLKVDGSGRVSGRFVEIVKAMRGAPVNPPPALLFHTGYCGSTLVARCLNWPGAALSYMEPRILVQYAAAKRAGHTATRDPATLKTMLSLLSRPFAEGERSVVKTTNVCGNLVLDSLAASPGSKAVLIYGDIKSFLFAHAGNREGRRSDLRKAWMSYMRDVPHLKDQTAEDLLKATDLQVAAMTWVMEMDMFATALQSAGPARLRSLDGAAFIADPAATLARLVSFLGLAIDENAQRQILEGPVLKTHSKGGWAFDAAKRQEAFDANNERYGEIVDFIVAWAKRWRTGLAAAAAFGREMPERLLHPI